MYVVTLITNPKSAHLSSAVAFQTAQALGVQGSVWLHKNVACDIVVPNMPGNFKQIWSTLQKQKIDVVVQPINGRRKNILIADMDSTMIQQECIDELANEAGVGTYVADITARSMNGELNFDEALRERVGLLKDLDESIISKVLSSRIQLMPGGPVLIATMKANGSYCALVSGGFTEFTSVISQMLGFDENRANTLIIKDGKLTGRVKEPILGKAAKMDALMDISQKLQLSTQDAMAVGDGANDLGMLKRAGCGVALHAKPSVAAQCDVRINHGDLTGLLYIQGYQYSDFVFPKAHSES